MATHLADERVGPYTRALRAALVALAPDDAFVPLAEGLHHLAALDPAVGGALLAPGEITATGMPTYPWLDRARAESSLIGAPESERSDAELVRISGLDPALGRRLTDRRALHDHLRRGALLPTTRLVGALRTWEAHRADVRLVYDRLAPDGRWVRVRVDVAGHPTHGFSVREGRLEVSDGLLHLFTRHFASGLGAIGGQLELSCGVVAERVERSWIGPFWFPDLRLPEGIEAVFGQSLLLHASTELLSTEATSGHDDVFEPPPTEPVPPGFTVRCERRFAGSGAALEAVRQRVQARGAACVVTAIVPPSRPRRL